MKLRNQRLYKRSRNRKLTGFERTKRPSKRKFKESRIT